MKNKRIPRWGRVQVTQQAERTRTIKCVLAESSRWLLHRRRDTKNINIPGCSKKIRKERKEKRKVGSKAQKHARKSYSRRLHSNKSSRLCYKAEMGTLPHHLPSSFCSRRQRYQVSLLPLSSPPPPRTNQRKPNKTAWTRGLSQLRFHLLVEPVPCHTIYHLTSSSTAV